MMVTHTLVFALSLVMLYSLPSDLLCMCTPSIDGMFQKEGEEDAKESWSEDAALLHAAYD